MNTLTKLALGLTRQLKPQPATWSAATVTALVPPTQHGGMRLMEALHQRQSLREFSDQALPAQQLSDRLWAAAGINRPDVDGRTAPSAMNAQEVEVHVALPQGLFLYDPKAHALRLAIASDLRSVTGCQDFVDLATLDLIYVADHGRMKLVPAAQREAFAFAAAGAMAQNVYLCCASARLSTVVRAWFDRQALARAMGLGNDHQLLLAQTVGHARAGG